MKVRKIKRSDRDTWVLLENLKGVMRSVGSRGACLMHFDNSGGLHFIWTYHDPQTKARMERIIELLRSNQI